VRKQPGPQCQADSRKQTTASDATALTATHQRHDLIACGNAPLGRFVVSYKNSCVPYRRS
jgi:hypothetical protein